MNRKIIAMGVISSLLIVGGVFVLNSQTPENKCIKGSTVSALMYLQTQGGMDSSSYAIAEKRLIATVEAQCKSMPKVHLDIRAQEGNYDIPLDREIELIKMCLVAGGHWDMGCRFF